MAAGSKRARTSGAEVAKIIGVSKPQADDAPVAVPPRFARHLEGAAKRRRGNETPWVAVARVDGVDSIREQWGDPAAEEFLRATASALRSSLRESDKLSPVGRAEYGIVLDAPSGEEAVAGLERLVRKVRELALRDHRWEQGSLCVGVTPLWTDEPSAILDRARDALERAERRGGGQVMMTTGLR
jgi:GGDEF domain-containing protein